MKHILLLISSFFCFCALAQDNYHIYEQVTCSSSENCLINTKNSFVIKAIAMEDSKGEVVGFSLSSSSNIADVAYSGSKLCYRGEASAVCGLLNMMSYDSRHVRITNFSCFIMNEEIKLGYDVDYDMGPAVESVNLSINKCN